ncbi:MAG: peptidylprolyl isomerase [Candidatus Magasanikbacteria bacterium RIFOXYC2_FULL_40_16]|uniref:Peptidyl-prolyl cis-trans isomerase n=1 Tax=Candidatus Magasanikbacteria bacterium RIFOXYC2_FULL_40_16 TaxID=1798703 RepID=A0A1F6P2A1_9BACT|nr:MAG: peptidylprolyl isomerase [Candidatus Magasanikbacteria bacterium RIFOXYB2_FULL_40_13]OGH90296.1 MAG: peptidylprolyl isomerase [Candidatus Magasanikbacteria bacterium RIFOXYC2_FULL_40_16]
MRNFEQYKDLAAEYSKAVIKTNKGDITIEFYADKSPITVNNFLNLAEQGFYNETKFHRVIRDFMIQGGDPNSKGDNTAIYGTGGPNYKFNDEFNSETLVRGSLAMANSGPNTNGSQFFIVTAEATPWLDGKHTNFGRVIAGMEVVDAIENSETDPRDNPVEPVVIESIELVK